MFKANPSSLTGAPVAPAHPQPDAPSTLLGGLSPAQFMRRYWQKKPLLIAMLCPASSPFSPGHNCLPWLLTKRLSRA
jgi:hypothetical protein